MPENTLINYNKQVTSKQDILNPGLQKDLVSSHCRLIDLKTIHPTSSDFTVSDHDCSHNEDQELSIPC